MSEEEEIEVLEPYGVTEEEYDAAVERNEELTLLRSPKAEEERMRAARQQAEWENHLSEVEASASQEMVLVGEEVDGEVVD